MQRVKAIFDRKVGNVDSKVGVSFYNIQLTHKDIVELYRSFPDVSTVMFSMPVVLLGLFARSIPERVTMENVRLHKTTNYANDHYMVAMTTDKSVAIGRDRGNYITIDTSLFQAYILDVHKTYSKNQFTFPARMEREKEHATLAILYCCVKSMTVNHEEIVNPFYIEIQKDNEEAINEFRKLYIDYLDMVRRKNINQLDDDEEINLLRTFLATYLNFYKKYASESNPFEMTISEMTDRYPTYMDQFFKNNEKERYSSSSLAYSPSLFETSPRLSEIANNEIENAFKTHPYAKKSSLESNVHIREVKTCYEDEYSRPTYD